VPIWPSIIHLGVERCGRLRKFHPTATSYRDLVHALSSQARRTSRANTITSALPPAHQLDSRVYPCLLCLPACATMLSWYAPSPPEALHPQSHTTQPHHSATPSLPSATPLSHARQPPLLSHHTRPFNRIHEHRRLSSTIEAANARVAGRTLPQVRITVRPQASVQRVPRWCRDGAEMVALRSSSAALLLVLLLT